MSSHVSQLEQTETVCVDQDQLETLYSQLGPAGAEDIVRRAMEELALRLAHAERLYRQGETAALRKSVRSVIAIADQLGLGKLSHVAADVTRAIDQSDGIATAATLARLLRVGEQSLTAIWDLQDLPI